MAPSKDLNQNKSTEQSPIDARLQQLSDKVLPSSPYILTIPTNYRVGSHQINDWRRSSPFRAHEEQLSYLTFMPRTFDEDNIMSAIGDWDDGNGAIKEKTSNARSGTSSPLPGQVPKKKISLADYKNKAAGQVGAKSLPQANGQIKAPEKISVSAAPVEKISKPEETEKTHGQKRYDTVVVRNYTHLAETKQIYRCNFRSEGVQGFQPWSRFSTSKESSHRP